jgi:putative YhdH/YhfP family quinone oxidoreductase
VTGASGGVGCIAVALLARNGFRVVAATGKPDAASLLRELGAADIVDRNTVDDTSERPLLKGRWAAVVDTVGGNILATALKSAFPNGCVTACGNVASAELHTTVYPFILRGVSLLGIDAANCALAVRRPAWELLAGAWKLPQLEALITECDLSALDGYIERIRHGGITGRVLVRLWN